MDLSAITAAQRQPVNQFCFDQKALDQSIIRAEKRRIRLRKLSTSVAKRIRGINEYIVFTKAMASLKKQE